MRDGVTLLQHLSLAGRKPGISPEHNGSSFYSLPVSADVDQFSVIKRSLCCSSSSTIETLVTEPVGQDICYPFTVVSRVTFLTVRIIHGSRDVVVGSLRARVLGSKPCAWRAVVTKAAGFWYDCLIDAVESWKRGHAPYLIQSLCGTTSSINY